MPSTLSPHPAAPSAPVRVEVDVARRGAVLTATFQITGDLEHVVWPAPAEPARANELWRTTCFEAFVRPDDPDDPDDSDGVFGPDDPDDSDDSDGYFEMNLSPSGRWAAYAFDGYRSGMRDLSLTTAPQIAFRREGHEAELTAAFDLSGVLPAGRPWRLALSAVIEDREGRIAYLALAHAPGRPDFHHPDSFALQLTADA